MYVCVVQSERKLASYVIHDADVCSTNNYQLHILNDSLHLLTYSLKSLNFSSECMYYAGIIAHSLCIIIILSSAKM